MTAKPLQRDASISDFTYDPWVFLGEPTLKHELQPVQATTQKATMNRVMHWFAKATALLISILIDTFPSLLWKG